MWVCSVTGSDVWNMHGIVKQYLQEACRKCRSEQFMFGLPEFSNLCRDFVLAGVYREYHEKKIFQP